MQRDSTQRLRLNLPAVSFWFVMFSNLNTPQREAVKYLDGPLLVLAGLSTLKLR